MPFCSFASEFPWCSQGFLAGPWGPHRTPHFLSHLILCASLADHGSELLPLLSLPCLCLHSISTGLAPSFGTTQPSSMTVQACLLYEDSPNAPPVVLLPGVPPEAVRAPWTHIESSAGSILTRVLLCPCQTAWPWGFPSQPLTEPCTR